MSVAVIVAALASCQDDKPEVELPRPPAPKPATKYPQIEPVGFDMPTGDKGERILDFSRVGYQWGDEAIPAVAVVKTINPPAGGADATSLIQGAIDEVAKMTLNGKHRGAILLTKGTYNVKSAISLNASGIVLRGEGSDPATGTLIVGTGTRSFNPESATGENLITVGGSGSRSGTKPGTANVKDTYAPEGQFWLRVTNPSDFKAKDNVVVYREVNDVWIKDLGMTGIWTTSSVNQMYAERVVTKIVSDTLWFENPLPCSIETKYGGGFVYKYSYANRVSECGVEDMALQSQFFSAQNETHCWNGVSFSVAEHCWMKNVTGKYFGFGLAMVRPASKNITVKDCTCTDFQSTLGGSRRYPYLHSGQLSIFINCNSEDSRHPFATSGSNTVGPNVFKGGYGRRSTADTGPHRHWSQGTLYEDLDVEGQFNLRNRYTNSSHGWGGTNEVAWNCSSSSFPEVSWSYGFIIQSPQVSGKNYAIGCVGEKKTNTFDVGCNPSSGEGVWISHGTNVSPASLYDAQLALRKTTQPGGVFDVK